MNYIDLIKKIYDTKHTNFQGNLKNLTKFNNYIKSVLLMKYCNMRTKNYKNKPFYKAIDLCCGVGGDILKWNYVDIKHVIFIDNSVESLKQLDERLDKCDIKYDYTILEYNCFDKFLHKYIYKNTTYYKFNVISCQFGFHYSFNNIDTLQYVLSNISKLLELGGYFICTIPDSGKIKSMLKKTQKFENNICKIKHIDNTKYEFNLKKCIMNSIEYYMNIDDLLKITDENKLECIENISFPNFYKYNFNQYKTIPTPDMQHVNLDEFNVISLYKVLVFKKKIF
jgi:mRNA (guanine-N7-)-methyltransferase